MSRHLQDTRPPEPGDLFVLAETAGFPVEWAVLESRPGDPGRLLAVPADTNPLAGSADVEVPADEPAGPLTLRCRFGLWIDAARFDPSRRTGVLAPAAVAHAVARRAELETGDLTASPLAFEADADPEYEDWVREILAPAQAVLAKPAAAPLPATRPSRRWTSFGNPYALAASILLLVTLGLAGGLLRQTKTITDLVAGHQRTEQELQNERETRRQSEETHRRELTERDRQAEQARAEDRRRIADLERRLDASGRVLPLVNPPFVYLLPRDPVRGGPDAIPLPPGASYLFVILAVKDLRSFPEYRLEIVSKDTGKYIWTTAGLHRTGAAEVSVALPRNLLPPDGYLLRLDGMKNGKAERVGEYEMRIGEKS